MKALALVLLLLLSGCINRLPPAPPIPTPEDIARKAAALDAVRLTPARYANVGWLIVSESCEDFFTQLYTRAANYTAAMQELGTAAAATIGIGNVLGMGAKGLGIAAITGALGAQAIQELRDLYGVYSPQTIALVNRALAEYLRGSPHPATLEQAALLVQGAAYLCSRPGIDWLNEEAKASAAPTIISTQPVPQLRLR